MRSAIIAFVALAALASAGDVIQLNAGNFDAYTNEADIILVKFYAPWCGHCKKLAPEYEKAATTLLKEEPPVLLGEVDATVDKDLAQRFSVSGYPTLKIFRKGVASPYSGPRDADGIVKYMKSISGPAAKPLATAEAFDKFVAAAPHDVSVVGFFSAAGTAAEKAFQSLASALREDYRFALVSSADVIAAKNGGKEGVFVIRPFEDKEKAVEVPTSVAMPDMTAALHRAAVPLASVFKPAFAKRYDAVGLPRVTAWAKISEDDPSGTRYLLNRLRKAGQEFKGRLLFVLADKSDKDFSEMHFDAAAKVSVGVISSGQRYKPEAADTFSVEAVKKIASDFLEGKIERYIKSEAVPETKVVDGLTTLTGKTFDEDVIKSGRDSLVLFYAPWCGHCKAIKPKYEELAKKLAKHSDLVTIGKLDATTNDYPPQFKVQGFPTIYFVKATDPAHPIEFNGEREVAALENFIKQHATKPIKDEL